MIDPAPVSVNNVPPGTQGCTIYPPEDQDPANMKILHVCFITQSEWSRQYVLGELKTNGIHSVMVDVRVKDKEFVFGNESFSRDLQDLIITANRSIVMSSGTFRGSKGINSLQLSQISLQFEAGWLTPLAGLMYLNLSHNGISAFPDMEFCHLKHLKVLDLSSNRISSTEEFGIVCNNSNQLCLPCLPNVTSLNIANNSLAHFNIDIHDDLPQLQYLSMAGCSLTSINMSDMMTLVSLNIRHNNISLLTMEEHNSCNSSLTSLDLQENKLPDIPVGLFRCIKHLKYLDLSRNQLSADVLNHGGLNQLTELEWLDLSYNPLKRLDAGLMGNLVKLQNLTCSFCGLAQIENDTFMKIEKLRLLKLDNNRLHFIQGSVFRNLHSLFVVDLSHNKLRTIPQLCHPQPVKQPLIMDGTKSTEDRAGISGIGVCYLESLSLSFNHITHISTDDFRSMFFLHHLFINNNEIKVIEENWHYFLPLLRTLQLNNNVLVSIPSWGQVTSFVEYIDVSHNMIRHIDIEPLTDLKWANLSSNNISKWENRLHRLTHLRWIDLRYNNVKELSEENFLTETLPRPYVLLQGNPLHCDCRMEWILNSRSNEGRTQNKGTSKNLKLSTNDLNNREMWHAEVADLDTLQCRTSGSGRNLTSIIEISVMDLVCSYQDECHDWDCWEGCCARDANCPCRESCYPQCSCYHNQNHSVDFMNCTSRNITNLPHRGPISVKQIYLNGNYLAYLSSDQLEFPKLTALFVNNSCIKDIHPGAFEKLKMLNILDLQQNYLQQIDSGTFKNMFNLKELYLQDNQIYSIENDSFMDLTYLRILRLDGNRLQYFNTSLFEDMKILEEVTLHNNPWLCNCQTGPTFQRWLTKHSKIIKDIEYIRCMNDTVYRSLVQNLNGSNATSAQSEFISMDRMININFADICNGGRTASTVVKYKHIKSVTEVISLAAAVVVFMLVVVLVYRNLLLIKVWLYNQFGMRLHWEENDNDEKPYDIFLTYPRQDEMFVVQHLLGELEAGDKSYRVCLEGRDWPPGHTAEMIITSVQQSKRTILLVSEHHFDTQWSQFTFEAGHYQVLKDKQIRLIIVLMKRNLKARMSRTMKMYLRTNAFLVVGEKWFWKKLRYFLADNPRGADDEVDREFRLMQVYGNQRH